MPGGQNARGVQRLARRLPRLPALLPARPGQDLVITTDTVTEGVDFFAFDPSADVARKALRVNLSLKLPRSKVTAKRIHSCLQMTNLQALVRQAGTPAT